MSNSIYNNIINIDTNILEGFWDWLALASQFKEDVLP